MSESHEIDLRSDEVQEILSAVPNWMIRYGISLIFVLVLMLIFLSWLIRYPDTITGNAIITTQNPTVNLVSRSSGYLTQFYVEDSLKVKAGETVAVVTNASSQKDMLLLGTFISECEKTVANPNSQALEKGFSNYPDSLLLGESQAYYNQLVTAIRELSELHADPHHRQEITLINQQISYNKKLAEISKNQLALMREVLKNAENRYEADSTLRAESVISKHEMYERRNVFISKQQELALMEKSLVQYKITVTDKLSQKNERIKVFEERDRALRSSIGEHLKMLRTNISNWEQNYALVSPIDGTLIYHSLVKQNRYINAEASLFTVIPTNGNLVAEVRVAEQGFGKVKIGQEVRIRLANYPYQQFGQLIGKVEKISAIASSEINETESSGKYYSVNVTLPKKLETTHLKTIAYSPNMAATADIVTEDLRLIDRIFNTFREVLEK